MSAPPAADLVVVGAGIVGLAHAYHAARRGMSVTVLERDAQALGASVRNFGMLATIAQQAGPDLDRAVRASNTWREVAANAGIAFRQAGCLFLACHAEERDLLREFAAHDTASRHAAAWLTREELAAHAPGVRVDRVVGGLWAPDVWKVDQRMAMQRIAAWLQRVHGVTFRFGVSVHSVDPPLVATTGGDFRARRVVVCSGDDFRALFPEALAATGVTRCQLQMLRTVPQPAGWRLGPFILGGLSIPRYKVFERCTGIGALRERLALEHADHLRHDIHVVACQEDDGSVTIGDSHRYGESSSAGRSAEIDALILDYLLERLALPSPAIAERWLGHYAYLAGVDRLVLTPIEGVTLVTVTSGQGLTHGFALAEDVIAGLP